MLWIQWGCFHWIIWKFILRTFAPQKNVSDLIQNDEEINNSKELKSKIKNSEEDYLSLSIINKNILYETMHKYKGVNPISAVALCQAFSENKVLNQSEGVILLNALSALEFVSISQTCSLENILYWFNTSIYLMKWALEFCCKAAAGSTPNPLIKGR